MTENQKKFIEKPAIQIPPINLYTMTLLVHNWKEFSKENKQRSCGVIG